jgi:hypothetical protein
MKYIFVGPSGYNLPGHFFDGWICLPPCKQTDIMKLVETVQPTHIALVVAFVEVSPNLCYFLFTKTEKNM